MTAPQNPQVTLYSHASGPNPWKVVFLLKALGISYETKYIEFPAMKQKPYTDVSPNGRVPAIVDHTNGGFALWESDAILLYLVDKYDKDNKFGGETPNEKALIQQWLFFQSSGQGPYFGQAAHFIWFAPEKIPYGVERYTKEVARVLGVLESVLSTQPYLVGSKVTIADLSFIPWNKLAFTSLLPQGVDAKSFPAVSAWHEKLCALPYVASALAEQEALKK